MATPTSYDIIFDLFYKRLKGDTRYFKYSSELSLLEIEELVASHSIDLLDQSIKMIYKCGNPDINLHDKDDQFQIFNISLVDQEIDLLIDLMQYRYFHEDKNKLHELSIIFSSSELRTLSPANERDSVLKMIKDMKQDCISGIENYLCRDRETWKMKSIYK